MAGWVQGDVATGGAAMVDLEKTEGPLMASRVCGVADVHSQGSPGTLLEVDPSSDPIYV